MEERSQSGPDFTSWLANELSAIRNGVDSMNKIVSAMQERVSTVRDDIRRIDEKIASAEKDISELKTAKLTKDSSWLGFWKLAAILPFVAAFMAIMNYLVSFGILEFVNKQ